MEQLRMMGFNDVAASSAFEAANGDLNVAIEILLSSRGDNDTSIPSGQILSESVNHTTSSNEDCLELDISQYSFGGNFSSACTPIASAVCVSLLRSLENGKIPINLLSDSSMLTNGLFDGLQYFEKLNCMNLYERGNHYNFYDIYHNISEFQDQIHYEDSPIQLDISGGQKKFQEILVEARRRGNSGRYTSVIITKPPESIGIILPPYDLEDVLGYLLFDSHSRPSLGLQNAYLKHFDTFPSLSAFIATLFPPFPDDGFGSSYETMMYNLAEGSPFQLRSNDKYSIDNIKNYFEEEEAQEGYNPTSDLEDGSGDNEIEDNPIDLSSIDASQETTDDVITTNEVDSRELHDWEIVDKEMSDE